MGEINRIDRGILDQINDEVVYDLGDGRRIALKPRDIEEHGLEKVLGSYGIEYRPSGRKLPAYQDGRQIGSLPADFDPQFAKSTSWFYQIRPGDFLREDDRWIVAPSLGPGDLEAIAEFVPVPQAEQNRAATSDAGGTRRIRR